MEIHFKSHHIRSWQPGDAHTLAQYTNHREVSQNMRDGFPYPYTIIDARSFISGVRQGDPETEFAIANCAEIIGGIGLMIGGDVHRHTAELGYWLARPFLGKGIMTQTVYTLTRFGKATFGLNRIYAKPYASNPASARVLEKAGFVYEGRLRANVVKEGQVLGQDVYSLIHTDLD